MDYDVEVSTSFDEMFTRPMAISSINLQTCMKYVRELSQGRAAKVSYNLMMGLMSIKHP